MSSPQTGDEIPIERGQNTYKIDYNALAQAILANAATGVKGNAESAYRTGNVNLTPANIGAKATQTAVTDPTASGTAISFIDSLTQNAQGVITPTKKTVRVATQSESGLMSDTDKSKLDGIASGAQVNSITGVKGSAEGSYRTGNVNLTPANIGALPDTTTAADIGASATFVLTNNYTIAATIYSVLNTMARGSVATIVTRADASNAMCGVNYDMYGTIWRNPRSDINNFYLSMTRTSGIEQYCYVLTLTESSMSHGTVYKYTGTAV